MTVTLNQYDPMMVEGTFSAKVNISGGTATAIQNVNVRFPITVLAGSTATTSFAQHKIVVPGATGTPGGSSATTPVPVEGAAMWIAMEATGPGWKVAIESLASGFLAGFFGTSSDDAHLVATGAFVLDTRDDFLSLRYVNERWQVVAGNATIATTT